MTTRIAVLPSDESACCYYRMKLPAGAVQQIRPDWDINIYRPSDVELGTGADGNLWQIRGIEDPESLDLIVMQRVGTKAQLGLVRWATDKGIAVVVDSDDDMKNIAKDNSAYAAWNNEHANWRFLEYASSHADLTTVTTKALADRYGKHGRTAVLPNCVPSEVLTDITSIRSEFDPAVTIGWAGFTATHPGDLTVVGDAVARAAADTGCKVRVIGDAEGAARDWGLNEIDGLAPVELGAKYYTALTSLDIGLVPLLDTKFNRAKSYLKALEFAAMGIPVIASPTPANRELSKTIPMFLPTTPDEWYTDIVELVNTPDLRVAVSVLASERISEHHTYEANSEKWAEIWERAMVRRARMVAV